MRPGSLRCFHHHGRPAPPADRQLSWNRNCYPGPVPQTCAMARALFGSRRGVTGAVGPTAQGLRNGLSLHRFFLASRGRVFQSPTAARIPSVVIPRSVSRPTVLPRDVPRPASQIAIHRQGAIGWSEALTRRVRSVAYTEIVAARERKLNLTVDAEVLAAARKAAAQRQTTLENLVREFLASLAGEPGRRRIAQTQLRAAMDRGLVSIGSDAWSRDELYDR